MCLCLAICGGLLTTTASAADDNYKITVHALNPSENAPKLPDPTGEAIENTDGYVPVKGVEFTLEKSTIDTTTNEGLAAASELISASDNWISGFEPDPTFEARVAVSDDEGLAVFDSLPAGLYLLTQTKTPTGMSSAEQALILVPLTDPKSPHEMISDIHVYPKSTDAGQITKELLTHTGDVITKGSEVTYLVKIPIPQGIGYSPLTKLELIEKPGAGLQISRFKEGSEESPFNYLKEGDAKIFFASPTDTPNPDLSGLPLDLKSDITEGDHYDIIWNDDGTVTVDFINLGFDELTGYPNSEVEVWLGGLGYTGTQYFYAIVKANVVDDTVDPVNNAEFIWATEKNPGETSIVTDPENPEARIPMVPLEINKVDEADSSKLLPGATFQVYPCKVVDDENNPFSKEFTEKPQIEENAKPIAFDGKTEFTTDAKGSTGVIGKINVGARVCVVETKSPAGYERIPAPLSHDMVALKGSATSNVMTVKNISSSTITGKLPLTGGAGIALFLMIGAGLLGAAYYYARKNKAQA
ncbi:SpaH/EbpB family LPXTG-anchored major pilin [Gleimia hominis]|nr:SpaH/EbpB family LPXTG-anchored major pilin [Gleimia hominis]WIK65425.1 SpaH/EbpB family LPXTG-anchored major pilin [Gleimia hominis]